MILSIDTGLDNYGLAVIDPLARIIAHVETIKTARTKDKKKRVSEDYADRISKIINGVNRVVCKYPITQITAEMPSFGAQSSAAAVALTAGATILLSTHLTHNLPIAYVSPRELKECFTGDPNADKKKIMNRCCQLCGWKITYKTVNQKNKPPRQDAVYHVLGKKLSGGYFEHIADAIAAYYTCQKKGLI